MRFIPDNPEKYEELLRKKIEENEAFTDEEMGGEPRSMGKSPYAPPKKYPRAKVHPRVFFTPEDKDRIEALINDPDYAHIIAKYRALAEARDFTGEFPTEEKGGVEYRFDPKVLLTTEAKAFSYCMTGNRLHGMEAIVAVKNMMLTLDFKSVIHGDTYHGASEVMVYASRVYDMCYDLLTERDKRHFLAGISNLLWPKVEFAFPPTNMSAVAGHGTGCQFLRDYVCVALTVFDEMPDWWELVGGRLYEEYLPVINHCYRGGWASQGTSNYGDLKLVVNYLSASYVKNATGEMPLVENGRLASYYMMSHSMPNERFFQTGDGGRHPDGHPITPHFLLLGAMLFDDVCLADMAKYYTRGYTMDYRFGYSRTISPTMLIIWLALAPRARKAELSGDLIQYFPYPAGSMTARSSWGEEGAVCLMRIGELTMGNHDIYDHGTFQIYYKGLLAASSGTYCKYGSNVHKYYLQSTVAQNGLLIYNPALGADEAIIGDKHYRHGNVVDKNAVLNGDKYYYAGGQKRRDEPKSTIDDWLNGNCIMGKVLGTAKGYGEDGRALYAYISGDVTPAYHKETVRFVRREMLTAYTDDKARPMMLFVHDTVVATDKDFRKSFLLHVNLEPEVDRENMTAVARYGEGRLTLNSLFGAKAIEKIGGEGYAYWISNSTFYNEDGTLNGKNCTDRFSPTDNYDRIWGRVELITDGNECEELLTHITASDGDVAAAPVSNKCDADGIFYAECQGVLAAFVKKEGENKNTFKVTVTGEDDVRVLVAGLPFGCWTVTLPSGEKTAVKVTEDSAVLAVTAKKGEVCVSLRE